MRGVLGTMGGCWRRGLAAMLAVLALGGLLASVAGAATAHASPTSAQGLGGAIATDREGTTHFAYYDANGAIQYCQIPRGSNTCTDATRKTLTVGASCTVDPNGSNTSQATDDLKVLLSPFGEVFIVAAARCKTQADPVYHDRSFIFTSSDDGDTFSAAAELGKREDSPYVDESHYAFSSSILDPADRRVVSIISNTGADAASGQGDPRGIYVQGAPLGQDTSTTAYLGSTNSLDHHPAIVQRAQGSFLAAWSDGSATHAEIPNQGVIQLRAYDCPNCGLSAINDAANWTPLTIPDAESDAADAKLVSGPLGTFLVYRRDIQGPDPSTAGVIHWYLRRIDGSTVGPATAIPDPDFSHVDQREINPDDSGPVSIVEDQATGQLDFAQAIPSNGTNSHANYVYMAYMVSGDGVTWSDTTFLPPPVESSQPVFGTGYAENLDDPMLSVSTGEQGFTGIVGVDQEPRQNTFPPYPIYLQTLPAVTPPGGSTPPPGGGTTTTTTTTTTSGATSTTPAPPTGTSTPAPTDNRCRILQFGPIDVLAAECLTVDKGDLVAKKGVEINGLKITGSELRFDPKSYHVSSTDIATISIGNTVLARARIDWQLPHANTFDLPSFDVGKLGSKLLGFGLKGDADAKLVRGAVEVHATIGLPSIVGGITSEITLRADNLAGLHVRELKLSIGDAKIGPLQIGGASLSYSPEDDTWSGGVKLTLPPDPPAPALSGEIGFTHGDLSYLKAALDLPGNGIPLDPLNVTYLTELRASLELNPLALGGGVTMAAGPKLAGDARAATIDGDVKVTLPSDRPFTIRADGKVALMTIPMANAYLQYVSDGHVTAGGELGPYDLGPVSLDGKLSGWFYKGDFSIDGKADICLKICAGGQVTISSVGMAACAHLGFVDTGAGIKWSSDLALALIDPLYLITHVKPMPTGCDVGPYRPAGAPAAARDAAGGAPLSVTFRKGLPSAFVGVSGATGAPQVALVGPDGTRIEPMPNAPVHSASAFAFQQPSGKYTWFAIRRPRAGRWSIVPAAGSTPVTQVVTSNGLPKPKVTARLTRRGRRRVLHYNVAPVPGQQVTFVEEGPGGAGRIGRATRRSGTLTFTPVPGGGSRRVVAEVAEYGIPRVNLTVAHFVAPRLLRPGRPRQVRLTRRGRVLVITYRRGADSRRDFALVSLSDGRRILLQPRRGRASLAGVAPGTSATVSIFGEDPYGVNGPKATARLRAKRRR